MVGCLQRFARQQLGIVFCTFPQRRYLFEEVTVLLGTLGNFRLLRAWPFSVWQYDMQICVSILQNGKYNPLSSKETNSPQRLNKIPKQHAQSPKKTVATQNMTTLKYPLVNYHNNGKSAHVSKGNTSSEGPVANTFAKDSLEHWIHPTGIWNSGGSWVKVDGSIDHSSCSKQLPNSF